MKTSIKAKITPIASAIKATIPLTDVKSVLSDKAYKLGVETLKSTKTTEDRWVKFTDILIAERITSDRLDNKNKEQEKTLFFQIERMIKESYGKTFIALLEKDIKTLSDKDKVKRRKNQQQIGSRFNIIRKHLRNAELKELEAENGTETKGREPRVSRTKADRIKRHINQALEILRGMEEAQFNVTQAIAELTKTYNSIK